MICVQSPNGRHWKGPSRLANRVFVCMPEWLMRDWSALSLRRTDSGVQATQFWSKGPMLRSETVLAGHKRVTLVRGEDYVTYDAFDAFSRRGISRHGIP